MSAPPAGRATTITPYPDGPYLIRGDFVLLDQDGNEIAVSRRTIALCRCGNSRMRPFCDGTHRATGFRAPGCEPAPDWAAPPEPTEESRIAERSAQPTAADGRA